MRHVDDDPRALAELKRHTTISIGVAENHKYSMGDILTEDALDIVQPNVNNRD